MIGRDPSPSSPPAPPAGWVIPDGYRFRNLARCRSCSAPIAWCETAAGRNAPLNRDGSSHFVDCPDAARWRFNR